MSKDYFIIRYFITSPFIPDVANIMYEKVYPRDASCQLNMRDPRNKVLPAREAKDIIRQEKLILVVDNKHGRIWVTEAYLNNI